MKLHKTYYWSLMLLCVLLVGCGGQPERGVVDAEKVHTVWERQIGSSAVDAAYSVSADSHGNVSIVGETSGSLDGVNAGEYDTFLVKYDSSGKHLWTRQLGSARRDAASGIATDERGNIFIAGLTFGDLDGANAGEYDAFVAKYDPDGKRLWIRQFGTASGEFAGSPSVDSDGNVYVAGDTFGNLGGTNAGVADAYFAKYDPDGKHLWTRQLGTKAGDVIISIGIDQTGNIYVAGQTDGDLGGTFAGGSDAFIAKYDSTGLRLWIKQVGGTSLEYVNSITICGSTGIFVTGDTNGTMSGANAGGYDTFVARYDADGNQQWIRQMGSSSDDFISDMSCDHSGGILITGVTEGSLEGANKGGFDSFIARYSSDGNRQWVKQIGSSSMEMARGICTDPAGSVYLTGQTNGSLGGANVGEFDAFLIKYTLAQ